MKKLFSFAMLAVLVALPLSGCITKVGVDAKESTADWNTVTGNLTVKYTGYSPEDVFIATKKALDQLDFKRVGENLPKDTNDTKGTITVFARAVGDIKITVDIYTATNARTKEQWTQISVSYGAWGNLQESQKIVSAITKNL